MYGGIFVCCKSLISMQRLDLWANLSECLLGSNACKCMWVCLKVASSSLVRFSWDLFTRYFLWYVVSFHTSRVYAKHSTNLHGAHKSTFQQLTWCKSNKFFVHVTYVHRVKGERKKKVKRTLIRNPSARNEFDWLKEAEKTLKEIKMAHNLKHRNENDKFRRIEASSNLIRISHSYQLYLNKPLDARALV